VILDPADGSFTVATTARPRKVELNADRDLLVTVSGS
jgi:hypothetical protein